MSHVWVENILGERMPLQNREQAEQYLRRYCESGGVASILDTSGQWECWCGLPGCWRLYPLGVRCGCKPQPQWDERQMRWIPVTEAEAERVQRAQSGGAGGGPGTGGEG